MSTITASVTPTFFQTRARFLKANQQRFTDWGEADNHRIVGAGVDEFHNLFVLISSYYQRLRWISRRRPIWYRQEQLSADACDRFLGRTPYGKMFSRISARIAGKNLRAERGFSRPCGRVRQADT